MYRSRPGERRDADRFSTKVDATLRAANGLPRDVTIHDLSATGFRMETTEELGVEMVIWIGIAGAGITAARVVRRSPRGWSCQFLPPITDLQVEAILLAETTIVEREWSQPESVETADPVIAKWPVPARIGFIISCSLALWALILWVIW